MVSSKPSLAFANPPIQNAKMYRVMEVVFISAVTQQPATENQETA